MRQRCLAFSRRNILHGSSSSRINRIPSLSSFLPFSTTTATEHVGGNFIRNMIHQERADATLSSRNLITRFPPEPNGVLHLGHAASICLNFGLAQEFQGQCHLRLDDTNPATEEQLYEDCIKSDVNWLGFQWEGKRIHTHIRTYTPLTHLIHNISRALPLLIITICVSKLTFVTCV